MLVYGIGNVELALVLGPSTPPLLPVLVLDLLSHPDLALRLDGSAAALLLIAAIGIGYGCFSVGMALIGRLFRRWQLLGPTPGITAALERLGGAATWLLLVLLLLTLAMLGLWSLAGPWRFPDPLPETFRPDLWRQRGFMLLGHAGATLLIAAVTSVAALALVLFWLEATGRRRPPAWLWLPLVLPQIAFLFGLQVLTLALGLTPGLAHGDPGPSPLRRALHSTPRR